MEEIFAIFEIIRNYTFLKTEFPQLFDRQLKIYQ